MIKREVLEERIKIDDVFKPKNLDVKVEVQQLFYFGKVHINEILRDFYEHLAQAIFSGNLRNRQIENGEDVAPDLTDHPRRRYIEVKAVGHTKRVMLKGEQIDKYANIQTSESFLTRIYFNLFRYSTRGIVKRTEGMREDDIIQFLAQDTKFMVGLPFSIVYKIHSEGYKGHDLASRTYGVGGAPCTNLSTRGIDLFFSNPEQVIESFHLNPEDFLIRRTKIAEGVTVNSYPLAPFPMTLIKASDSYHKKFVRQLEEKSEEVPF
mgnify:CR=1 FL=1